MATESGQLKIAFFPIFLKIVLAPAHFRITRRSARALSLHRPVYKRPVGHSEIKFPRRVLT